MERYLATIKGKQYWYARDRIYINKGQVHPTTACLGRKDTSTNQSILTREERFRTSLVEKEAELRTKYWQIKVDNQVIYTPELIKRIELSRTTLYRAKNTLGDYGNDALEHAFLIDFIYNSNRIEGSRLPRLEVQRLLIEEGKRNNEVRNTEAAREYLSSHFPFSIKGLVQMHRILLAHEPSKHGLRREEIVVGNDPSICHPHQIRSSLQRLFSWYHEQEFRLYPPELAFLFYYRFERIHPFIDGNGRIGRLLMNQILKRARYHPIIIWNKQRIAHFSAFKRGMEGTTTPFLRFMNEQFLKTYETYSKKVERAIDFEKYVTYFMSPSEE
jgi:Fic family protein